MLILLVVVAFGLLLGSFLNVVIFRLHAGKQFITGRSACPHCGKELSPKELVPVVSWLVQRGKCRHCKKPISRQYPLVELLTAIVTVVTYLHFADAQFMLSSVENTLLFGLWLYVVASFIVLTVYDLRWYLLPDKVLLPLIGLSILIHGVEAAFADSRSLQAIGAAFGGPLLAGLLFGGSFYALAALSKGKWMGGGDIKLAFVMGLLLGLEKTALAMLLAFNGAAIVGLALIALKFKKRSDLIPFGPFLVVGTLMAFFAGDKIINWYLQISGLYLLSL